MGDPPAMICLDCRHENPSGARFCNACGVALAPRCPRCKSENPIGARFCNACGTALETPTAHEPAPERSPRAYTPKHLADKILRSKSALEGERKQVTVLFADVKGSMDLAEQLDPEQWHQLLERFFEILTEGVHRFEGTVNQYTGDGIMALFGAPIAHEDHAQRACHAALHLQGELAHYATDVKREHGVGFHTRMGINSGEVIVGAIGDDLRMDYTAQGHTVGLAQRMESLAEPNTCFVSATTAALVSGYFALEDLGEFVLKGSSEPMHVHQLTGTGALRTRFDIARASGLSRFVGRAADLRTLEHALEQTAAGNGQVIGVVAEAGTGKSRLCFEFVERCRDRGMQVFEARAVAHGTNIPLLPILELFRAYFGIAAQDDDRGARDKIVARLALLGDQLVDTAPLVHDFLGVADPQQPAAQTDPEARLRRLLGVLRELAHSASASQPMVTMIEDLHWLDAASAEFLEHLVEATAGSRSLLLLNFRPEYHAEWMQKSWYRQVPLTPLAPESIGELLADLLGDDPSLAALEAPIYARTAGNPFFTEEVVQSLIESGYVRGERGRYRVAQAIDRLEVPATVQTVLAARIDRLAEREKRVLQVASVIGKDFPQPLLSAVTELSADELDAALVALRRAEFVHELSIYPVHEYTFKHPLTQQVALESQLKEHRKRVHVKVAMAIEEQDAARLEERAALLAHHWEEAGELLTAAQWHRRAAEWFARTEFSAAIGHWQQVRSLVKGLAGDRDAIELGVAACTQLLSYSWRVGPSREQDRALLDEGQALADSVGDRSAHLLLAVIYARAFCAAGDVTTYLPLAAENRRAALDVDDEAVEALAAVWLVDALGFAGRFAEAIDRSDEGLAGTPRHLPDAMRVVGFEAYTLYSFWRGVSLNWSGRLGEGLEELERCRRLADEDGSSEFAGFALSFSTEGHYFAGDAERALTSAAQLDEISRGQGEHAFLSGHAHVALGWSQLAAGRAGQAIEMARRSLDLLEVADKSVACQPAALLAEAVLLSGDLSAALAAAMEAIDMCRRVGRPQYEAIGHGVRARALLRRDGPAASDEAKGALDEAAALIEQTGAEILAPSLLEWRAELAGALGRVEDQQQLLSEAQQRYEGIGAPLRAERLASSSPRAK
jgi:adenylate cyclase